MSMTKAVETAREGQGADMSLAEIRADFELLEDWEDRYRYVIELGRGLEPLRATDRTDANKVRGCASQVWLVTEVDQPASPAEAPRLHFRGESDAHIVRGLIAILFALYQDKTPDEILAIDPRGLLSELGLVEHLTPQRSNGFAAMVERIRSDARARETSGRSSAATAAGSAP
jgi:cysteine desulfuration protein SufE